MWQKVVALFRRHGEWGVAKAPIGCGSKLALPKIGEHGVLLKPHGSAGGDQEHHAFAAAADFAVVEVDANHGIRA